MNELTKKHLESGNIFISYTAADDKLAEELGYEFVGVSVSPDVGEIHIWQIESHKTHYYEN